MVITEEEFLDWKELETTKALFKSLVMTRENMKENLILGLYDNPSFVEGKGMAIKELIEMNYKDLQEALTSD